MATQADPVVLNVGMLENAKSEILRVADEAYARASGDYACPLLVDKVDPGARGDTLADFIAAELRDVMGGEAPEQLRLDAASAMRCAASELEVVADALEDLCASSLNRLMSEGKQNISGHLFRYVRMTRSA